MNINFEKQRVMNLDSVLKRRIESALRGELATQSVDEIFEGAELEGDGKAQKSPR